MSNENPIPSPLLEKGDQVVLTDSYKPMMRKFSTGPLAETIRAHISRRAEGDAPPLEVAYRTDEYSDLFEFSHGIIAEILERHPWSSLNSRGRREFEGSEKAPNGPVRNVSLYLYNPTLGTLYSGDHPTEPGKPEFVDVHATQLTLTQKHDRSWGASPEINISEVHSVWGLPTPFPEEDNDD